MPLKTGQPRVNGRFASKSGTQSSEDKSTAPSQKRGRPPGSGNNSCNKTKTDDGQDTVQVCWTFPVQ